jgi:HD superfamily phosphohydrolase
MKHIKDPIHGYIDVPDAELSIINTPIYQRLRRIQQLGMSETVYPSASHTRFAHSLGVMHLTRELGESIGLEEEQVRENQVAGLLHDVGHLPFSHTFESLFESKMGYPHEKISCKYIDKIAERQDTEFPVDKQCVKDIILGEYDGINLVSNEIDCDRLDYLLRDSYHTGIELGQIEQDTLIKFAEKIDGQLGFDHKSLRSVERLLDARMQMNYSVYSHDTVQITETMIERAVEGHIDNTEFEMSDFVGLDDAEMGRLLLESDYTPTNQLYSSVRDRSLYKTAYYNSLENESKSDLEKIEEQITDNIHQYEKRIAERAGVEKYKVIITSVNYNDIKEYQTPIRMPSGDIRPFEDVSPKPNALRQNMKMDQSIHVFSHPEFRDSVKKATNEEFRDLDII